MTYEEIIWDVLEIINALDDDSDIEELWVLSKINQYRAIHIANEFALTNTINPVWLQRVRKFKFEKITSADDPNIDISSITLGKANISNVVSLPDNQGLQRVSGSGAIRQMEPCSFDHLMLNAEINGHQNQYGYYTQMGTDIYSYPYISQGSAVVIAEDPTKIQINDNGTLRDVELTDDYPLDSVLIQKAVIDFLTRDMKFKLESVTDLINDSSDDKFKVMHGEA